LALGLIAATAGGPEPASEIVFAERAFAGWAAAAATSVEYERDSRRGGPFPYVGDVRCRIVRNGMTVALDRKGRFAVNLSGEDPRADEENSSFSTTNIRFLRLDGVPYEAKAVQTLHAQRKFRNFDYPRFENDDIILPVFSGHIAVRRRPDEPWLDIVTLLPQLIRGTSLRIGHGRMADGRVPRIDHLDVPLAGLREALIWCEGQIVSEAAYRLPPR
jgi:hypothetical protein